MTKMFDVRNSDAFRRIRDIEKTAKSIFYNSPLFVPGVLQVPAYVEEVIYGFSGLPTGDSEAVERIQVRNDRHATFLKRLESDDAPEIRVVLDESVLRRGPVVASAAKRNQIEHLIELSRSHPDNVHIGVIPMDRGFHQGLAGSFEVYDSADGSQVFFEDADGDQILDDAPDRITLYRDLVGKLLSHDAVAGEEARTLMSKLISG